MNTEIGILEKLPPELVYLVQPAMKYGIYQFGDDIARFHEEATPEDLNELAAVADRIRESDHNDRISDFLDQYPITHHPESANLYFLFAVMDEAGLNWLNDNWNTVETHIKQLGKFGSFRLASERAHAARFLAQLGDNARPAIPALHRALDDEDLRVQVWAHYALAVIEGNRNEHEQAVQEIFLRHSRKDKLDCLDDVGRDARAAIEKFGEL